MALFFTMNGQIADRDELSKKQPVDIADLTSLRVSGAKSVTKAATGVAPADAHDGVQNANGEVVPFAPIGQGKPLAIEIRNVYTGKDPEPSWFSKTKDLVVTSATKGIVQYAAAPRAVNFLKNKVSAHQSQTYVAAPEEGTPVVYYSPAMTNDSIVVTIEAVTRDFPTEVFKKIASTVQAAAGIPMFATASMYLVAGGIVANLIADLGQAIFNGTPFFRETVSIDLFRPGSPITLAGFALVVPDNGADELRDGYQFDQVNGRLVRKDDAGSPYRGDIPYVVLSYDGNDRATYKDFQATQATAAILDKFFNLGPDHKEPADVLIRAMQLANDIEFRDRADKLKQWISQNPTAPDIDQKKAQLGALIKNISETRLQPLPA